MSSGIDSREQWRIIILIAVWVGAILAAALMDAPVWVGAVIGFAVWWPLRRPMRRAAGRAMGRVNDALAGFVEWYVRGVD